MNRCECDNFQPCGAKPLKVVREIDTTADGAGAGMSALVCPYSLEGHELLLSDPGRYRIVPAADAVPEDDA